jgi:hypothetical protein
MSLKHSIIFPRSLGARGSSGKTFLANMRRTLHQEQPQNQPHKSTRGSRVLNHLRNSARERRSAKTGTAYTAPSVVCAWAARAVPGFRARGSCLRLCDILQTNR